MGIISNTTRRIRGGPDLPASPVFKDAFMKSGANAGLYVCLSNGTWSGPLDSTSDAGDVVGPASSTDNALARFDSTTGKLIQNSAATVDDNGSVNIPAGQTYKINGVPLSSGITNSAGANVVPISDGTNLNGGDANTQITANTTTDTIKLQAGATTPYVQIVNDSGGGANIELSVANGRRIEIITVGQAELSVGDGLNHTIEANSGTGTFGAGDTNGLGNSTQVVVNDGTQTIALSAPNVTYPGTLNGIKRYVAVLTQTGTDAPVASVLENSLGDTLVWTRSAAGVYNGTLAGVFLAGKSGGIATGTSGFVASPFALLRFSDNVMQLTNATEGDENTVTVSIWVAP